MHVTMIRSNSGEPAQLHYATTCIVNGSIAIDAGALGFHGPPADQRRVKHILLTHSHADHVGSLPLFLENACGAGGEECVIYGGTDTLRALAAHLFNDVLWPDYFRIADAERPRFRLEPLEAGRTVGIAGVRVTPVPVHHSVPTFGFVVEDPGATVVFSADSGPTEQIWERARAAGSVAAVFVEVAFPDRLEAVAARAGHLTPRLLLREIEKMPGSAVIIATHLKPSFHDIISEELAALNHPRIETAVPGTSYRFGE